jgi:hypothetical protein
VKCALPNILAGSSIRVFPVVGALLAATAHAFAAPPPQPPALEVARAGPVQPVFVWQSMRCEEWDVPDTGARAWRDAQGRVHLLASSTNNRVMIGADLDHVAQDCRVVFKGGEQDPPQLYDDRSWLASTYTQNGNDVFALIHNEFHGQLRPALCPARDYAKCWANTLTLAVSHDGGISFTHAAPPKQFVAGLPYRYRGDIGHRVGYFNPSNIIFRDGYHYAYFWAEAEGAQRRGACLMRTSNLADARAWRGWNGKDFGVAFADPYVDDVTADAAHVCAPVGEGGLVSMVSSVTLHRLTGLYVALMATYHAEAPGKDAVSGVFVSTSSDLIHWTPAALVWQAAVIFKYECSDRDAIFYPSLLDPGSATRNFEDAGDHAELYFTDLHIAADCHLGPNRDLVRVPVDISALGQAKP